MLKNNSVVTLAITNKKKLDSLQWHIKAKHSLIIFDCDECDYQTPYKQTVMKHKRSKHHNGLKPYACGSCVYRTTHKYSLLNLSVSIHGAIKF